MIQNQNRLSLKEQIGQLIVVRASGYLFDHQIRYPAWEASNSQLQQWLRELNLGGVILLGGSSIELQARTQQLQSWAKTPLLIAADIEEGVGQRFPGATWFPPPMALGDIYSKNPDLAMEYACKMGAVTAVEAQAIGINWLLAPVVDVNNNPDNPVINVRAFGDNPQTASDLAAAFIQGAKSAAILTTAKHFPGHGDTATDSHLHLPSLPHSEARLASIELPPFEKAIATGVDSVMTAHLLIPAWDRDFPATLSAKILNQLRQQLGFDGLVVTDALIMGGITKFAPPEEVAVMAIEAGSDVLLMPDNPEIAISAIYNAVRSGRIKETRIYQSLNRIGQAKAKVLLTQSSVTQPSVAQLSTVEAQATVAGILQNSMRTGGKLPLQLKSTPESRNLIVVDDILNSSFLDIHVPAIFIPQQFDYQRQIVDCNTLDCVLADSRPTLLQIFIRGNPFRGMAGLTNQAQAIYQQLLQRNQLEGLIIYGSPYVLDWFSAVLPQDFPWVFTYGQNPLAQAIALATLGNLSGDHHTSDLEKLDLEQNFGF